MARMKKIKDPFEDLDDDFKNEIAALSPEDIKQRISKIVENEIDNQRAKAADVDLANKQHDAAKAAEQYKAKTKTNNRTLKSLKLKIEELGGTEQTKVKPLQQKMAEVALDETDNLTAMKADQTLAVAKEALKMANETYSDVTKYNKLRVGYCAYMLEAKGAK